MNSHIRTRLLIHSRGFKNFGHKRQPEAPITVLWHGFLTFSLIGLCINWKNVSNLFRGDTLDNLPSENDASSVPSPK